MRYYVRKEDLIQTLNELTRQKNQKTVRIYKDVMMYRFSNHPQDYSHVENMLMIPRKLMLSLFNVLLAMVAALVASDVLMSVGSVFVKIAVPSLLYLYLGWQIHCALKAARKMAECFPYVVVDELLARKIIVLTPKKKAVEKIKTAK